MPRITLDDPCFLYLHQTYLVLSSDGSILMHKVEIFDWLDPWPCSRLAARSKVKHTSSDVCHSR